MIALTAVAACLALPSAALAAPPGNDDIDNATELSVPDIVSDDTNVEATTVPNELNSEGNTTDGGCLSDDTIGPGGQKVGKTVWYTFVGTGEPVTISTNLGSLDTVVFVYHYNPAVPSLEPETCNDDIDADAQRYESEAVLFAEDGERYYVQVGGCCGGDDSAEGDIVLTLFPPPDNDLRSQAETLPLNTTRDKFTVGALEETGEVLACQGTNYAKTVWYRIQVAQAGELDIATGGFRTVAALYRGTGITPQGCAVAVGGGEARLKRRVTAGTYLLQVGGVGRFAAAADGTLHARADFTRYGLLDDDGDGSNNDADCNDNDRNIHPGAASVVGNGVDEDCDGSDPPQTVNPDRDNDRYNNDVDCQPDNPAINPGAAEIPGNQVDENCDGVKPDYERINASYRYKTYPGHVVRFKTLRVKNIPAGATLRLTCKGKGCKGKRKYSRRFSKARSGLSLLKQVKRYRLRKGARVEIRITAPNKIGRVFRIKALADGDSTDSDSCLRPGARRTTRCR